MILMGHSKTNLGEVLCIFPQWTFNVFEATVLRKEIQMGQKVSLLLKILFIARELFCHYMVKNCKLQSSFQKTKHTHQLTCKGQPTAWQSSWHVTGKDKAYNTEIFQCHQHTAPFQPRKFCNKNNIQEPYNLARGRCLSSAPKRTKNRSSNKNL